MSQPRRRRRRRRKRTGSASAAEQSQTTEGRREDRGEGARSESSSTSRSRRRRRRRGARRAPEGLGTLEEIERSIKPPVPANLTAPPDGQTLEGVIGDLQSVWGVPQYPQEYKITLKVAEERSAPLPPPPRAEGDENVQREKAPAAPRMGPAPSTDESGRPKREKAPRRRRGSRRSRRRRSGES